MAILHWTLNILGEVSKWSEAPGRMTISRRRLVYSRKRGENRSCTQDAICGLCCIWRSGAFQMASSQRVARMQFIEDSVLSQRLWAILKTFSSFFQPISHIQSSKVRSQSPESRCQRTMDNPGPDLSHENRNQVRCHYHNHFGLAVYNDILKNSSQLEKES